MNYPLHLSSPLGVTPFKFHQNLWQRKTRVPGLSCVILHLAIFVDVVYFDIAKAFDTVNYAKLIHKLQAYGIDGNLLSLLADFLEGRSHRVVLPGGTSSWKPVLSGVPQGSVLGPLLFLLYINDITDLFPDNISIKLFADDIKIYMEIEDNSQTTILQQYVDAVMDWAKKWNLRLSYNKCQHMCVTLGKSDIADRYSCLLYTSDAADE